MQSKANERLAERVEQVLAHMHERLGRKASPALADFVRRFFARVAPEDVLSQSVEGLYGAVVSLWKFAEMRPKGAPGIRAFNPRTEQDGWSSAHTVIQLVNDDMPFLVDTVAMTLAGLGHGVHLLIHPIVNISRDADGRRREAGGEQAGAAKPESLMHVEIGELTNADALGEIEAKLQAALADVRDSVADWRAMLARLRDTIGDLQRNPPPVESDEASEAIALLEWMGADNFTFLGYREYDYGDDAEMMRIVADTGLGILRNPGRRVMVGVQGFIEASDQVRDFLRRPEVLIVTKANARSSVHRPVLMDYVGVRRFDAQGRVIGERRFVGLFTSAAYNRNPRDIPLLRRKVARIIARAGLGAMSHDGKALLNILETYPRDELFQIGEDELYDIAHGVLLLHSRPRPRLFLRRDEFGRFVSALVYVPREGYDTALRKKIAAILEDGLHGHVDSFYTQLGDEPLARIHFIVATRPGARTDFDAEGVEQRIAGAARSWVDGLLDALRTRHGEEKGAALLRRYAAAFPTDYRERYDAAAALFDIAKIESLDDESRLSVNLYRPLEAGDAEVGFKLYHLGAPVPLSDCLPVLEHLGLKVIEEHPFEVARDGEGPSVWIHDLSLTEPAGQALPLDKIKAKFEAAFVRVWQGAAEDDRFNRLVVRARLDWREVVILRAFGKYLRQTGIAFSQRYMEDALSANAGIARMIVALFHIHFDPALGQQRDQRASEIEAALASALDQVASLDEDRILRRFLNLVRAARRTNFYQKGPGGEPKPALSIKFESAVVDELPLPRPLFEIFVYAPQVEGIHLRGGRVARGGIRWSDRREDFRTEVLSLMKAQQVKNAVIVPVGAKGGFVPKRPPVEGGRDAVQADGVECYRTFIRALLDITDNRIGAKIVPPKEVVRLDSDDPYFVVAADKGTATFSDIANSLSAEYGFWLGDAFASGGSAGYDHKKMGITARGAWEMVKRHFRELGRDVQREDFTVVGIGDMSGDVFGNGMLQSEHIRLLAAFDHRHVFIDPEPDVAKTFAERKRMFALPRSSWADFDPKLISRGGGVFDRKLKSIRLSPEVKARFRIERDAMTPTDLIHALLQAEVDLLWNGGIGTYVKASSESHADVGDRANDGLRVDGRDLKAKVVGEGGNLGFTQRGRIEYALKGGRINTDALDNSAGVDTSDHEVNIKILLDAVVAEGELTLKQRDRLTAEVGEDVAALVLQDNYLQGQAVSVAESQSNRLLPSLIRLMRTLEQRGRLDRGVEFLPSDAALAERQASGSGLTRPELAVLLAYAKMSLYDDLLASDLPDEPHFAVDLAKYFPRALRKQHGDAIAKHRLRREIVATSVANSIINRVGPGFVGDIREETEAEAAAIARAYVATRDTFGLRRIWTGIEALDNKVPAALQTDMLRATIELMRRSVLWLLREKPGRLDIEATVQGITPGVAELKRQLSKLLVGPTASEFAELQKRYTAAGVPGGLADEVAALGALGAAFDIIAAAERTGRDFASVARIYFMLGDVLGLDWLREAAARQAPGDTWQRLAVTAALEDLDQRQRALAIAVLSGADGADPKAALDSWMLPRTNTVGRLGQLVAEYRNAGGVDAARLAIANRHLKSLDAG